MLSVTHDHAHEAALAVQNLLYQARVLAGMGTIDSVVRSHIAPRASVPLSDHDRHQIDLSQTSLRHSAVHGLTLMLLIVCYVVLDGSGYSCGLDAVDGGCDGSSLKLSNPRPPNGDLCIFTVGPRITWAPLPWSQRPVALHPS